MMKNNSHAFVKPDTTPKPKPEHEYIEPDFSLTGDLTPRSDLLGYFTLDTKRIAQMIHASFKNAITKQILRNSNDRAIEETRRVVNRLFRS